MPFKPMKLSFGAAAQYIEAFSTMFSGTGKMYHNTGNDISRSEFPNGYALYAFDLTPNMCGASTHFNVVQKGNLAIDIQFSAAPAASLGAASLGAATESLKTPYTLIPKETLFTTTLDEHLSDNACPET